MEQTAIIGIDISRRSFQLHGATAAGEPVFRRTLSRGRFLDFLSGVPRCLVVMEACGGARHWGRAIIDLGRECKLIPPVHVKPFVKRQKSDSSDAAAIVEAAQGDSMLFGTRALLVRQRAQTISSLRGHLAESGIVAARGVASAESLEAEVETCAGVLPEPVRVMAALLFTQIATLSGQVAGLDRQIRARTREREDMRRLMTIPGVGPVCAMAVHAFAPPMETFRRGRDFAAWAGLTPRQHSAAGRQRLGRIARMGQRDIRQLLVLGATTVLRHARLRAEQDDPWLRRMLAEKPPKLVAVALANRMARVVWALSVREEDCRAPAAAMATKWLPGREAERRAPRTCA